MEKILQAANSAPSAGNLQAYEIFVVQDPERRRRLAKAAIDQEFIAEASVDMVFCAHPARSSWRYGRRGELLYCVQDATIAAAYAQLAAAALGLGSVWVGAFDDAEVLAVLGNPRGLRPVAIISVGYPAEEPEITTRRRLEDIVHNV